jgi:hypothetical protein
LTTLATDTIVQWIHFGAGDVIAVLLSRLQRGKPTGGFQARAGQSEVTVEWAYRASGGRRSGE